MTIYQLLRKDHEELLGLFDQVVETTERAEKTRTEVLQKIKEALIPHAKAEQKVLYTRLEKNEVSHDITIEAEEEHRVAERLLKELLAMDVQHEHWIAKMTVLQEALDHHIEEEQDDMFKKAEKVLTTEEAVQLGEEFLEEKKAILEKLQAEETV